MLSFARAATSRSTSRLPLLGNNVQRFQQRSLSSPSSNVKRSTAVPHGIIFVGLSIPACLFAVYNVRFGPTQEEQIMKVEERYKKEIEDNADNYSLQMKMIQKTIANPDSMDAVSRELLDKPKASTAAQTKRLMTPEEAAKARATETAVINAAKAPNKQSTQQDSEAEENQTKKRPWWKIW